MSWLWNPQLQHFAFTKSALVPFCSLLYVMRDRCSPCFPISLPLSWQVLSLHFLWVVREHASRLCCLPAEVVLRWLKRLPRKCKNPTFLNLFFALSGTTWGCKISSLLKARMLEMVTQSTMSWKMVINVIPLVVMTHPFHYYGKVRLSRQDLEKE